MTVSSIVLYTGNRQYLADALGSLKVQTRAADQLIFVDASADRDLVNALSALNASAPAGAMVISPWLEKPILFKDALNLALEKCNSDYVFAFPAQHMLAPGFIEQCARKLDENTALHAVGSAIRLIGLEDAIIEVSIAELLAFPERDCFALFRVCELKAKGGFTEANNQIVFAETLLQMAACHGAVEMLPEWLILARYEQLPHKPALHRVEVDYDREEFLKRHRDLLRKFAMETVSCLEKEHGRQQTKFDSVIDHAHRNLLFVSNKQQAQEKFHKEQLSSVRVTGFHLLKAVKARLAMRRNEAT